MHLLLADNLGSPHMVCITDGFHNANINLQLIYTGAIQLKGIFQIDISIPVGVESLNCTGEEQNWTDCSYILQSPSGSCDTTASISCQGI